MKKLLIISNLVWASFFALVAFRPQQQLKPQKSKPVQNFTICYNYGKQAFNGITYSQAETLAKTYQSQMGADKTQFAWFSLEELKKFLWNIENSVQNCKAVVKKDLGVRIYYGRYPSDTASSFYSGGFAPFKKYAGKHNLFMVPTFRTQTGSNADFDMLNKMLKNCKITPLPQMTNTEAFGYDALPKKGPNPYFYKSPPVNGQIGILDMGCLGPPDCDDDAAFNDN